MAPLMSLHRPTGTVSAKSVPRLPPLGRRVSGVNQPPRMIHQPNHDRTVVHRAMGSRRAAVKVRAEATSSTSVVPRVRAQPAEPQGLRVPDEDFSIAKTSFGSIASTLGIGLLTYGFGAYFQFLPGQDVAAVLLIYGFPITLIGFALKYAQLEPVACISYQKAADLRESQATNIQNQLRNDVTRFRYGDEQHLDEALKRIFLVGRPGGISRRQCPRLVGIREEVSGGNYSLVLEFDSPRLEASVWEERLAKIQVFFGPGVAAELTTNGEEKELQADLRLTADGSGEGRGEQLETMVLPPLAPGMPARTVVVEKKQEE